MTQKTINIVFGVTTAALLGVGVFAVGNLVDKLEAKDKAITLMVAEANDASVNGDMVLSNVDNNQQEQLYKLRDNLIALSQNNSATVAQLKKAIIVAAEGAAAGDAELADQFNAIIAKLGMALEAKFAQLEADLDENAMIAEAQANSVMDQLDLQIAKHNAFVEDATAAISMLNADDLKKLERKLEAKVARLNTATINNERAVARQMKTLEHKKMKLATQTIDGWFWQQNAAKAQARLEARNQAAIDRLMKRVAKDKAQTAKAEAKLAEVKALIAKLTV